MGLVRKLDPIDRTVGSMVRMKGKSDLSELTHGRPKGPDRRQAGHRGPPYFLLTAALAIRRSGQFPPPTMSQQLSSARQNAKKERKGEEGRVYAGEKLTQKQNQARLNPKSPDCRSSSLPSSPYYN